MLYGNNVLKFVQPKRDKTLQQLRTNDRSIFKKKMLVGRSWVTRIRNFKIGMRTRDGVEVRL